MTKENETKAFIIGVILTLFFSIMLLLMFHPVNTFDYDFDTCDYFQINNLTQESAYTMVHESSNCFLKGYNSNKDIGHNVVCCRNSIK